MNTPAATTPPSKPRLIIVIDTEEEFDWGSEFDPSSTSVSHMDQIHRIQNIFDDCGATPVYVVDYPIASQERGFAPLKDFMEQGRAVIGAHLHPWVTPPQEEIICSENSYPGNLPRSLEAQKLSILTDKIEDSFGRRPTIYKAGRYGLGPNTFAILEEQGYDIDVSPCPPMDLRGDGGPDYTHQDVKPKAFGSKNQLMCLPNSGAFVGSLSALAPLLFGPIARRELRWARLPGIAARLGLFERIRLSPETSGLGDMIRLTSWLHARGARDFIFSFHSPNVELGHTPYVRTEADLAHFLGMVKDYFDFFVNDLGGMFATPHEIKEDLISHET